MKIVKEALDNLERIINTEDDRINAVMNLNPVMADAMVDSEKYDAAVEDEMEKTKKIANKDKVFLGRHAANKVVSNDNLQKMHLSEDLFDDIASETITEEVVNEATQYNPAEEEIFWKLAKEKMSDEAYKNLCKQLGKECNESAEPSISYEEAKDMFAQRGIELPKDIYNLILNANNMSSDMIMKDESCNEDVPGTGKRLSGNAEYPDWSDDLDLWDVVYTELYGNKFPADKDAFVFRYNTTPGRGRLGKPGYRDSMSIDPDGNIQVWAANEEGLALAKKVCDGYHVPYEVRNEPTRSILTAYVPEEDIGVSFDHTKKESLENNSNETNEELVNENAKLLDESSIEACSDGDCKVLKPTEEPLVQDDGKSEPMSSDDVDKVIDDIVKEASDNTSVENKDNNY